jgi:hypothetical protein
MAKSVPSVECKKCGGSATYDFQRGVYHCQPCAQSRRTAVPKIGTTLPTVDTRPEPTVEACSPGKELPLEELEKRFDQQETSTTCVTLVDCKGCGAQVEVASNVALAECPFCDRKVQTRQGASTVALHEPQVLPFRIGHSEAVGLIKEHLETLWLRPGSVRTSATVQQVRKVFVPFWAFDVQISTEWQATLSYLEKSGCLGSLFGKENEMRTRKTSGESGRRVDDWLVCASHGIDASVIAALEPFGTNRVTEAPAAAVMGQTPVEVAWRSPRAAWTEAQRQMLKYEYLQRHQTLAQAENIVLGLSGRARFGQPIGKALVLPLYILSVKTLYGRAQVVVNGETGKVASKVPYSWPKAIPTGLAAAGAAGLVMMATMGTAAIVVVAAGAFQVIAKSTESKRTFQQEFDLLQSSRRSQHGR